ncbi:MAG: carbamoyltransferase family protein [Candidatus Polarisedimenticolia bacterium]
MITLGINAAFHDPAACLVRDGAVVAAAEEERFTRVRHGKRPAPLSARELPFHAIHFCLGRAGIHLREVDHVAYSFDPWLPAAPTPWRDPGFTSSVVDAPRQLAAGAPPLLASRFGEVSGDGPFQWHFVSHHLAHASSAFLPSPFEEAAVMTLDSRGEKAATWYGVGRGDDLRTLDQVEMPHSLGLLYERVTEHLGFLHASDESKVMALASYGTPGYLGAFRDAIRMDGEGQYTIRLDGLLEDLGPPRRRGGPIESRHHDIAASLQAALEESVLHLARWLHHRMGENAGASREALCLAGNVALNCVLNARLRDRGPFRRLWVQPASGEAGTAIGAALWVDGRARRSGRSWRMEDAYLGPSYDDGEIEGLLRRSGLRYRRMSDVAGEAAGLLAAGRVLGWFQGRMEFGPRALGARSILASPLKPSMRDRVNEIKDREDFRPVAPVVLEERAAEWFTQSAESPFMLFSCDVRPDRRSRIPAVEHVDGSARIQTVRRSQNALYHALLAAFCDLTDVPVLINTSFNARGEPIVCTPRDAVERFRMSPLDDLVIGSFHLSKQDEG